MNCIAVQKGKLRMSKSHRIALYIRVSTEEQAANPEGSIKNQEERLRAVVKLKNMEKAFGEIKAVYVEAKSGKDTNRAELQKLLAAIRRREINLVMVTELSRISRSVKDFSEIWSLMQENGCGFLSLRENFDTTNAAGEMVLLIMATLAQFERRQISERVSANFTARSKRGLHNGGCIAFGYKRNPERPGYLDIDPEPAEVVRKAFAAFIREGALMPAARWLNEQGIRLQRDTMRDGKRRRSGYFTIDILQGMIRNKTYAGIKVYTQNDETREVEAVWPPIVDRETFDLANGILSKNKKLSRLNEEGKNSRYPYILSSLVSCKACGDRLPGKSAHGKYEKIGYYEHAWATRKGSHIPGLKHQCWPYRILAKQLEPAVWEEITKVLTSDQMAQNLHEEAMKSYKLNPGSRETERLRQTIFSVDEKLETLSERLATLPSTISPTPIYNQMEKLEGIKRDAQRALGNLENGGAALGMPVELKSYSAFREGLRSFLENNPSDEIKTRIARYLIRSVKVHADGFDINWALGDGYIRSALASWEDAEKKGKLPPPKTERAEGIPSSPESAPDQGVRSSNILTNGRGGGIRTHDLFVPKKPDEKRASARSHSALPLQLGPEALQISANLAEKILMILQVAKSACYANATQADSRPAQDMASSPQQKRGRNKSCPNS
jgi:site-specific DNA recombinase